MFSNDPFFNIANDKMTKLKQNKTVNWLKDTPEEIE